MGGGGSVGGWWPVVALEVSPLREVAAAAGDEPSRPTSECGKGGRRRRQRGSDLLQMGWLPSTILPFLALFIAISLRSRNRFHFLVIYRIFCFIFWEFKNGSRVWIFCQGNLYIFHASLIVV